MLLCVSSLFDKCSAAFHLPALNREGAKDAKGVFGCVILIPEEGFRIKIPKPFGRETGFVSELCG
jgi:hypothetical protein